MYPLLCCGAMLVCSLASQNEPAHFEPFLSARMSQIVSVNRVIFAEGSKTNVGLPALISLLVHKWSIWNLQVQTLRC